MSQTEDTIVTLTFKQVEHVLILGGCPSWQLDQERASKCDYLVCTRNQNPSARGLVIGSEAHGTAFLIGKISSIEPTNERSIPRVAAYEEIFESRSIIRISEYALVNTNRIYPGAQGGFAYMNIEDTGIAPSSLTWRAISPPNPFLIEAYNKFHAWQRMVRDGLIDE